MAEILDKMSEGYNFFVDDTEKFMKSQLHFILKKLDCILNTQLRCFMESSMDQWSDFMRSFVPSPLKPRALPSPLIMLRLVTEDNERVRMRPDPEDLLDLLFQVLDAVTECTDLVKVTEFELVPFCNISQLLLFDPLKTADGVKCNYEPLERAKEETRRVVEQCIEAPLEVLSRFEKYGYLLTEEIEGFDPLDVEQAQLKIAAYSRAGLEVEHLSASILDFPLFRLDCSQVIAALSARAKYLADQCLGTVSANVKERADEIVHEWESTHNRILASPENEEQLAQLKVFMRACRRRWRLHCWLERETCTSRSTWWRVSVMTLARTS